MAATVLSSGPAAAASRLASIVSAVHFFQYCPSLRPLGEPRPQCNAHDQTSQLSANLPFTDTWDV